jgi:hypothetical protein
MTHGGSAPQVRAAAEARLLAMIDPALGTLNHMMRRKKTHPTQATVAARDVLDRTLGRAIERIQVQSDSRLVFATTRPDMSSLDADSDPTSKD